MTARDIWPDPEQIPQWWKEWAELSESDIERMREEYEREQIASAQSEAAQEANKQEFRK